MRADADRIRAEKEALQALYGPPARPGTALRRAVPWTTLKCE